MSFDFENAATAFIKEFRDTVTSALRLPNDVAAPDVVMNDEKAKLTATFHLPLCVPPPQGRTDPEPTGSQLYSLYLKITLSTASTKKHLAVFGSSYQVRLFNNPCIRFEYEKCKREKPAAHIHLSGIAGPLSTALMGNYAHKSGKDFKSHRAGDLSKIHIPLGGHRFRPSIEDFLYFVIEELGFEGKEGWKTNLEASRNKWHDIQLSAAIRDNPEHAFKTLKDLGFIDSSVSITHSDSASESPRPW